MIRPLMSKINLDKISEEDLLERRICDLPLDLQNSWVQGCVDQLYKELEERGIVLRPKCYFADEWLTPQYETVIGIPFFLGHPALVNLERKMMLEVEGGTREWCMKLLRHEAGHAIFYAYRLQGRKSWQKIFGHPSKEYTDTYRFRPYSKSYVRHLENYYAQFHPEEDFVETFAVWLTPNSNWEEKYKGWPAIRKLRYVDELMDGLRNKKPPVKHAQKLWRHTVIRSTLKNFYKKRMHTWAEDFPHFHDSNLKQIFLVPDEKSKEFAKSPRVSDIIKTYKQEIIRSTSSWTGEKKYIIHNLVKNIQKRCKALRLVTTDDVPVAVLKISTYITTLVMNYQYTGRFRGDQRKKKK